MRIAMIGLRGIPAKSGGVEVALENLAPRLVKLGADVTVYCRTPYCKTRPSRFKGVKLIYLPTINKKHTEAVIHSFLSTSNALFKNYDIVHYHALANSIFSAIPRITGKKTVVTIHGLDYERDKWGRISKSYLRLCEYMNRFFPNRIISVSKKIRNIYKRNNKNDTTYIPNGVNIENPTRLNKLKRFNIQKDEYILFLGRLVPEKGIHTLIDAFKQLKTTKKLLIAGDATHTEEYVKKLKLQAEDDKRIIFTGPLYGEEKNEAYSNAYAFVLPSTIEGMPIVLLEAMSFGLCPVVSDIKENLEVTRHCIPFKTRNASDLKDKLQKIIANPKLKDRIGKEAKRQAIAEYSWDRIAEKTYKLYGEAMR